MSNVLKYGATAKWLHWLVGIIVILMLAVGPELKDLPISERK